MSQPIIEHCECEQLDKLVFDKYSNQYFCAECGGIVGETLAEEILKHLEASGAV